MKTRTSTSPTNKPARAGDSPYRCWAVGAVVRRQSRPTATGTFLPLLLLSLTLPAVVRAQFSYTVENGCVAITRYTGPGGVVTIPDTIDGLPVTAIWPLVFSRYANVPHIAIPATVTYIGPQAFANCYGLTDITVDEFNPVYRSVDGVLFSNDQTVILTCPEGRSGN